MSNQSLKQQSVRSQTGTTLTYEGDFHALFDLAGIADGPFNGRFYAFLGEQGMTGTTLQDRMNEYAISLGYNNWNSLSEIASLETDLLSLISATHTDTIYAYDAQQGKYVSYGTDAKVYKVSAAGVQTLHYQDAATNLCLYSNTFDNAAWNYDANAANLTRTSAAAVAPDGTTTAYKFIINVATKAAQSAYIGQAGLGTPTYSAYAWMKKAEYNYGVISVGSFAGGFYAIFDLDSGTVATSPTDAETTAAIKDEGNGWYRCMVSCTDAAGLEGIILSCSPDNTVSTLADGTSGIYVWEGHVVNKTIAQVRDLGPIFTAAASDSTDRTVYRTADNTWINQDKVALLAKVIPHVSTSEATGDQELVSLTTAAGLLYYDATAGALESTDGTNTASNTSTLTAGTEISIGLVADSTTGKMQIYDAGGWGAEATYDGAFTSGSFTELFRGLGYSFGIKELRYTARAQAAGKAWVEANA